MTTPGTPGIEKPMSERSAALRPISYQIDGLRTGRCGSPARRGLALVVFAPASAQQFEPRPSPAPASTERSEASPGTLLGLTSAATSSQAARSYATLTPGSGMSVGS